MAKAGVRTAVEAVDGVTGSWFEWNLTRAEQERVLVVEVDWDTDPNSDKHRPFSLDAIHSAVKEFLEEETTMVVHHLKVVPKRS